MFGRLFLFYKNGTVFLLIFVVTFQTTFWVHKNCSLHQEPNWGRPSREQARWPLDHHRGSTFFCLNGPPKMILSCLYKKLLCRVRLFWTVQTSLDWGGWQTVRIKLIYWKREKGQLGKGLRRKEIKRLLWTDFFTLHEFWKWKYLSDF